MAKRIQLSRKKGYRKPPDAVNVARPTKWGNPFNWKDADLDLMPVGVAKSYARQSFEDWLSGKPVWVNGQFIENYLPDKREWILSHLPELQGKDLACWCKADHHCHADVLLRLANKSLQPNGYRPEQQPLFADDDMGESGLKEDNMFDDVSGTSSVLPTVSLDDSHILIAIQEISSFSNATLIGAPHQKFQQENDTWFWSEYWQAQEREADQDLRLGNYEDFDTMDDFIASL